MPYIAPDGTVCQSRPWSVAKVTDWFWGIINFAVAFCRTLIPGGDGGSSNERGSRPGGSGGGPGAPGGPRRRMGGITTIQDCSMPGGG